MAWQVIRHETGEVLKIYPYKLQCVIWCYFHHYVYWAGRFGDILSPEVKIEEV